MAVRLIGDFTRNSSRITSNLLEIFGVVRKKRSIPLDAVILTNDDYTLDLGVPDF